ncbi:MAG TPA: AMP-dependent synthetase, partial [Trueperaceae bacterium]|nr:AMP-dependent synthetase [Trueperaceae bacterium]
EHLDAIKDNLNKNMLYWLTGNEQKNGFHSYNDKTKNASTTEPKEVEINDDDPYNIIYSSGTTGLPKGIVLSHNTRANYCTMCANYFRVHIDSVVLQTGSIVFNGAFLTLMPAFYLGATYILEPSFKPDKLVDLIKQERVTHMMLVPSQIIAMLEQKQFKLPELSSVEMILTVGAPLHQIYKDELDKRVPKVFYELYGLTEGFFTVLDYTDFKRKPNSVGNPVQFSQMRIVDDTGKDVKQGEIGEIIGKSPFLMTHYYKDPKRTAEAVKQGWLYSGDLGYTDEQGFLYLADRKKDMIISGGINVYPNDIEAIISQHKSVVEVAVFGVAHPEWGETPVAAVILRNNDISEQELKEWVNQRVEARYQKLSKVIFLDNFPRSSAGKTLKRELRETFAK